jgi:hypothetical protein
MRFASVCAAAGKNAVDVPETAAIGSILAAPFGKDKIRTSPLSGSRAFAVYGAAPSNVGSDTFLGFSPTRSTTGVCPDTWCRPLVILVHTLGISPAEIAQY